MYVCNTCVLHVNMKSTSKRKNLKRTSEKRNCLFLESSTYLKGILILIL